MSEVAIDEKLMTEAKISLQKIIDFYENLVKEMKTEINKLNDEKKDMSIKFEHAWCINTLFNKSTSNDINNFIKKLNGYTNANLKELYTNCVAELRFTIDKFEKAKLYCDKNCLHDFLVYIRESANSLNFYITHAINSENYSIDNTADNDSRASLEQVTKAFKEMNPLYAIIAATSKIAIIKFESIHYHYINKLDPSVKELCDNVKKSSDSDFEHRMHIKISRACRYAKDMIKAKGNFEISKLKTLIQEINNDFDSHDSIKGLFANDLLTYILEEHRGETSLYNIYFLKKYLSTIKDMLSKQSYIKHQMLKTLGLMSILILYSFFKSEIEGVDNLKYLYIIVFLFISGFFDIFKTVGKYMLNTYETSIQSNAKGNDSFFEFLFNLGACSILLFLPFLILFDATIFGINCDLKKPFNILLVTWFLSSIRVYYKKKNLSLSRYSMLINALTVIYAFIIVGSHLMFLMLFSNAGLSFDDSISQIATFGLLSLQFIYNFFRYKKIHFYYFFTFLLLLTAYIFSVKGEIVSYLDRMQSFRIPLEIS